MPPIPDGATAAVLVLWGAATPDEVDALLTSLEPLASRTVVLRLPGGDIAAKDRFYRASIELELLDQLPATRSAATDLLVRLEILGERLRNSP